MITLADLYQKIKGELAAQGIETAALDTRVLLCHALAISHEDFILKQEIALSDELIAKINGLINERLERKPVAKIIGKKEFYGLEFTTTKDTLDPRPDSETLIDAVLKQLEDKNKIYRILDLGTGTGCLLLTLLHHLPNASGIGVDRSDAALVVSRENAKNLGLMMVADFVHSNWFDTLSGQFDVIVSNPPYIPSQDIDMLEPEVRLHDPRGALDGGQDGLDGYRRIIDQAKAFLKPDGLLVFEVGAGQAASVTNLLKNKDFNIVSTARDFGGIERVIIAKCL